MFTTGAMPMMTCGNWISWFFARSSGFSGLSEFANWTVFASICLMPPPEPIA
jgi:hypothetical protein